MKKIILCGLLTVVFAFNSHISFVDGSLDFNTFYGRPFMENLVLADDDVPIEVVGEELNFYIDELKYPEYGVEIDYSKGSAKYTLSNTADYAVDAELVFPIGERSYGYYDEIPNSEDFNIKVNGEIISREIRHTYLGFTDNFAIEEDKKLILDDYATDPFYSRELKVYRYDIMFEGLEEIEGLETMVISISDDYQGRICLDNEVSLEIIDGHKYIKGACVNQVNGSASSNNSIYFIGYDYPDISTYIEVFDESNNLLDCTPSTIAFFETTFEDFVLQNYDEKSGISKMDWYNGALESIGDEIHFRVLDSRLWTQDFFCWYTYSIHFEPNQVLNNEVETSLVPDIFKNWDPNKYTFNYLLSPSSTQKNSEPFKIKIFTSAYLIDSSLEGFREVDGGYEASLSTLPAGGECSFTLCMSDNPFESGSLGSILADVKEIVFYIMIVNACSIIIPLFFARLGKKRKKYDLD